MLIVSSNLLRIYYVLNCGCYAVSQNHFLLYQYFLAVDDMQPLHGFIYWPAGYVVMCIPVL